MHHFSVAGVNYSFEIEYLWSDKIYGWIVNHNNLDKAVELSFLSGKDLIAIVSANVFRNDLVQAGVGTGRHGFALTFAPPLSDLEIQDLSIVVRDVDHELVHPIFGEVKTRLNQRLVYIEISDVINFLRYENRVTGIQRLVTQLCWIIVNNNFQCRYKFCALFGEDENFLYEIQRTDLVSLLDCVQTKFDTDALLSIINKIISNRSEIAFSKKDLILGTGASFSFQNYCDVINKLIQDEGVCYGTILYDLIPYYSPSSVSRELARRYSAWLGQITYIASFVISISQFTSDEFLKFTKENDFSIVPQELISIPLGSFIPRRSRSSSVKSKYGLEDTFILYVSSVEVRKNHSFIIKVIDLMLKNDKNHVPQFVFVGKPGNGFEKIHQEMQLYNDSLDRIVLIGDASDDDLEWLYTNCLYTIYPSLYEGWGLPVSESLMRGKFCICSKSTSLPEAGGEFVDYFNPCNTNEAAAKFFQYLKDRELLKTKEDFITNHYYARTWHDYACDIDSYLNNFSLQKAINESLPCSSAGKLYLFKSYSELSEFPQRYAKAYADSMSMLHQGRWSIPDDNGVWFLGNTGSLKIRLSDNLASKSVKTYIKYRISPQIDKGCLQFYCNGQSYETKELNQSAKPWKALHEVLTSVTDTDACIEITFTIKKIRRISTEDARDLFIYLQAVAISEADNIFDQISILEKFVLKM